MVAFFVQLVLPSHTCRQLEIFAGGAAIERVPLMEEEEKVLDFIVHNPMIHGEQG